MKKLILTLILTAAMLATNAVSLYAQCGGERWQVKIGTDPDARLVNLNSAVSTSIDELSALPVPAVLPETARNGPIETTTWSLKATLVKYVLSYDSDYHIVFRDSAGRTMIGEIPNPNCVGFDSPFAAGIAHARTQFDSLFAATTVFQTANLPVEITGVGFFGHIEGQEGIAPNGIELHPIIDIKFGPTFSLAAASRSVSVGQVGRPRWW